MRSAGVQPRKAGPDPVCWDNNRLAQVERLLNATQVSFHQLHADVSSKNA